MNTPRFIPTPTPQSVEEFRTLYRTRFGQSISMEQARDLASSYLLTFYLGTSANGQTVDKAESIPTMYPQKP